VRFPFVSVRGTYAFGADGAVIVSDSTLRFRSRDELESSLVSQGYRVLDVRQAPDRPGPRIRVHCRAHDLNQRATIKSTRIGNVGRLPRVQVAGGVGWIRCRTPCITVAVFLSVTALRLSVAHESSGAATYRHLLSVGPVQAASAARRVL
jgi:hypothetical protein